MSHNKILEKEIIKAKRHTSIYSDRRCFKKKGQERYGVYLFYHFVWNLYNPSDLVTENEVIHHKDGNSLNDEINNLYKTVQSLHAKKHMQGCNNPQFGKFGKDHPAYGNIGHWTGKEGTLKGVTGKNHPCFGLERTDVSKRNIELKSAVTEQEKDKIVKLILGKKKTVKEMALKYNICISTVYGYIKRANLQK
jgi:hypothetical protein